MRKIKLFLSGILIGTINGLLGSGGGMLAVPLLQKLGLDERMSHSTSVSVILPMTLVSAFLYWYNGNLQIQNALFYIPFGIAGAIMGGFLLPKINEKLLRKIFGFIILYFALKILFF